MDVFTTSYLRSNIIAWLPIKKEDKVLFIDNGILPIKDKLKEFSTNTTCVSARNCKEIKEKFDYIVCIGNFSEVSENICKDSGMERFGLAKDSMEYFLGHLKENGRLILAVENRLGLKYWSGAKEEKSHSFFAGLGQGTDISGFSRREMSEILEEVGCQGRFYYPFPDYRFAMSIYSDEYPPKIGELSDQIGNFDEERLTMFDESMAMDSLIGEGLFPSFSNSFLVSLGKGDASLKNQEGEEFLFVKFSNDRDEKYKIMTCITKSLDGRRHLLKLPEGVKGLYQIMGIERACVRLSDVFSESRFSVNQCHARQEGMELEFLTGHTLEEEADRFLEAGEEEKALELILEVAGELRKCKNQVPFEVREEFMEVFGRSDLPPELLASEFSDIDAILPNILLGEGRKDWTLIDYEWSFDFLIPVNFVIYRMIHYYVETAAKRQALKKYDIYQRAGISPKELEAYPLMEESFQKYILGAHIPLRQLYKAEGKPVYHVKRILNEIRETERKQALTLYFDRGNGFSEEDVMAYRCEALDGVYDLRAEIPLGVKRLRIDPGNEAVTVDIKKLCWEGKTSEVMNFVSNGHKLKENLYLFDTKDPNILLESLPEDKRVLLLELKIETMNLEAAEWIAEKIDKKYKLKKMLRK
ncbi:MAG: hypothetical protein NC307_06980 [Roseburia sp.]|nr:hypothetical protein [Roseburia sp.]